MPQMLIRHGFVNITGLLIHLTPTCLKSITKARDCHRNSLGRSGEYTVVIDHDGNIWLAALYEESMRRSLQKKFGELGYLSFEESCEYAPAQGKSIDTVQLLNRLRDPDWQPS